MEHRQLKEQVIVVRDASRTLKGGWRLPGGYTERTSKIICEAGGLEGSI